VRASFAAVRRHRERVLDSVNREPLFGASERQTSGAHREPEYRRLPGELTQQSTAGSVSAVSR
jgi:hypothetical protein